MASTITEEGAFTLKDGTRLYTKTWKPASGPVNARLALLHGFSDHCDNHDIFSATLASRGISVYGYDQRGWGKSVTNPRERGRGGNTEVILGDLTEFLESLIAHDDDAAPSLFLCGHSMGGAIALTYAALGPPAMRSHIRGYVISSPLLALHPSYVPPLPLRVLLSVGSRLFPHLQIPQKIDPEVMSRDPEVQKAFKEDKLGHGIGTPEGMWGMLERGKALMDGKVGMDAGVRVWVGHGTADQLTSWEASKKWVEEVLDSRDKELKLYDGWRHRLHGELGDDKITFANHVSDWMLARATGATEPKSKL